MTDSLQAESLQPSCVRPEGAPNQSPDPSDTRLLDPRLGSLFQCEPNDQTQVVLVGFPCDEGVERNGGRAGAAQGPTQIRRALFRLTPDVRNHTEHVSLLRRTTDLGDLRLAGGLDQDQERLAEVIAEQLDHGRFVVVLGGGHETAYGHALGQLKLKHDVHILNWDAHPDVRPLVDGLPHSGSPFRQALEHSSGLCRSYTVAGLEPWCVAKEHLSWLHEHGCQTLFRDEVDEQRVSALYTRPASDQETDHETDHETDQDIESPAKSPTLVTFDLDALPSSVAPGVSAPGAMGIELEHWYQAARLAGSTSSVRSIDVVELNPSLDQDSRTARVAALTVWHCLAGLASRRRTSS